MQIQTEILVQRLNNGELENLKKFFSEEKMRSQLQKREGWLIYLQKELNKIQHPELMTQEIEQEKIAIENDLIALNTAIIKLPPEQTSERRFYGSGMARRKRMVKALIQEQNIREL